MKLKELEQYLGSVKPFSKPKLALEQYATDAHIAARTVYTGATAFDDFEGKSVLDLGCGCGMLSIASILVGAERVVGVDIDPEALDQMRQNMEQLEMEEADGLEAINANVLTLPSWCRERFDTVVLNPPFGTKDNAGIDVAFLQVAQQMAREGGAIYSMHKSSTREHLVRKGVTWGLEVQVLAQLKFEILQQFKFHKKERVYVDVDLIRFSKKSPQPDIPL